MTRPAEPFDRLLHSLEGISLDALDERAALLRRTDVKYIVDRDDLTLLIARLGDDYDVLEIADRRSFAYDTVYFDTDDLRCFSEHAEDVKPRFKARTRRYVDSGPACSRSRSSSRRATPTSARPTTKPRPTG